MNLEQTPAVAVGAGLRADTGGGSTQKSHPPTPKDGEQEMESRLSSQPDTMASDRYSGQSFTEHPRI